MGWGELGPALGPPAWGRPRLGGWDIQRKSPKRLGKGETYTVQIKCEASYPGEQTMPQEML